MIKKLLFFLLIAALTNCSRQPHPDVAYTISPIVEDGIHKLKINMRFAADPSGETQLNFADAAWGETDLYQTLDTLLLHDVKADIIKNKDSGCIMISHDNNLKWLNFEYVLRQDTKEPISSQQVYRPIIQPEYFHVFSHNLFMVPDLLEKRAAIMIEWAGFSDDYILHNSFASKERRQRLDGVSLEEFGSAIFVGGDFKVYDAQIEQNNISLACRGAWIPFEEQTVLKILKKTLQCQRDFWNDHTQSYFTVTMQPTTQEWGSSFQGTGLTNSFATSISNNANTTVDQLVYLFNHELMHNWIGDEIQNANEEQQYWFSEGFTEYYAFKNIAKNKINGLSASYFIASINDTARNLYGSSIRNAPNSEINYHNFWSSRDFQKLPYYRGALFAFCLDQKLQHDSQGGKSLDDVMFQIFEDAKSKGQKIDHEYFIEVVGAHWKGDFKSYFSQYIEKGDLPPLTHIFDLSGLTYSPEAQLFELGFELSDDKKKVISVDKNSEAYKAGLREGDRLFSRNIEYGAITKPVELGIVRSGKKIKLSFHAVRMAQVPQIENSPENQAILRL